MDLAELNQILLLNRGLVTPQQQGEFFSPLDPVSVISPFDSLPAIQLIKTHLESQNKIAIYGDYDVDGICSTAILWETLHAVSPTVFPHIPHRESEGYGLSIKGIDHCLSQGAKLIIAVDNGIVAHEEIKYCQSKDCDIVIIDHHEAGPVLPVPNVLLHSTLTCAAGLTWLFCRDFTGEANREHLSLVATAVICDIVPLVGVNRSFAKHGLEELNKTRRAGFQALFQQAGLEPGNLGTYEVGFVIGPRINAMGRLEHAIDSLRLLCTKNPRQALELALMLGDTNKSRQDLTTEAVQLAFAKVDLNQAVLVIADTSFHPGVIGLIAAKLTEKYYRPSIVISVGEKESKASARSVAGFHITDHIRKFSELLINAGGHAMAAGFTVDNAKLEKLMESLVQADISDEVLTRKTRIDAEIPWTLVGEDLYKMVQQFAPFGLGNPQPVFETKGIFIDDIKKVGKAQQHSKLNIKGVEAMAFNFPEIPENPVNIVYSLDKNTWNGLSRLQLIVKNVGRAV